MIKFFIVNTEKRKKITGLVKKMAIYLIYAAVIYFIFEKIEGTKGLVGDLSSVSLPFLSISLLIYTLTVFLYSLVWYFMMRASGENVTVDSQIDVYLKSFMLRYIPGNVVGILSRGEFNHKYGVSRIKSLWAWFLENIIFLVIGMSLASYFLVKNLTTIFDLNDFISSRNEVVMISGIAVVVITVIASYILLAKGEWIMNFFNRFVVKRILKNKKEKPVSVKFSTLSQLTVVLGYIACWALYSLSFLAVVYSVNPSAVGYPLALISVNALAWSTGYLFILTPSGTGIREAAFVSLLPLIGGITAPQAVIIALAMRLVTILGELLAFSSFELYLFIKNRYGKK